MNKELTISERLDDAAMLQTIQATVAKNSTPEEFKMFIEVCKATGLNPFLREIWCAVPMKDGKRSGPALIMAGRDGYLRVANEHPQFDGMETLVERDAKGIPVKATCKVWRKDRSHPITCEAFYNEYVKGSPVWQQYKSAMVAKVAEVLALKRSFSINGVVTEEEIGEQGSHAAQQEVSQKKIEGLKKAKTPPVIEAALGVSEKDAEGIIDVVPEDPPPQLEEQLKESIEHAQEQAAERERKSLYFKDLEKVSALKKKMAAATGDDALYYTALGAEGYEHANEIPASKMVPVYRAIAKVFTDWKSSQ